MNALSQAEMKRGRKGAEMVEKGGRNRSLRRTMVGRRKNEAAKWK